MLEKYFPDIEILEVAIILVAHKMHYDRMCKKGHSHLYVQEAFQDGSFTLYCTEIVVPYFELFGKDF